MGKAKLQGQLGITEDQTKALLDRYHHSVPFVKQLIYKTMDRAQKDWIRTILGRKCRFEMWEPSIWDVQTTNF